MGASLAGKVKGDRFIDSEGHDIGFVEDGYVYKNGEKIGRLKAKHKNDSRKNGCLPVDAKNSPKNKKGSLSKLPWIVLGCILIVGLSVLLVIVLAIVAAGANTKDNNNASAIAANAPGDFSSNGLELNYRVDNRQNIYTLNVMVKGKVHRERDIFVIKLTNLDNETERTIGDIWYKGAPEWATHGTYDTKVMIIDNPRTTTYMVTLKDCFTGRIVCKKKIKI